MCHYLERLTAESPDSVGEIHTYLQEYRGIEHFFNHFWTSTPPPIHVTRHRPVLMFLGLPRGRLGDLAAGGLGSNCTCPLSEPKYIPPT